MAARRRILIFGSAGAAVAAAVVAAILGVQASQRREYVRVTIAGYADAERAYAEGRFEAAATASAAALAKLRVQPSWFEPSDTGVVEQGEAFWRAQHRLWTEAQAAAKADPRPSRKELDRILRQAKRDGEKSSPLAQRVEPILAEAAAREKASVLESIRKQMPLAQRAFETGTWPVFRARVEFIQKELGQLPEASREEARREAGLEELVALGRPLAEMEAIADAAGDEAGRADNLRDLLERLGEPKAREAALRREILSRIGNLDKETRPQLRGSKLPEETIENLVRSVEGLRVVPSSDSTAHCLQGPRHRYVLRLVGGRVLIETDRVRLLFAPDLVDEREGFALETAGALARALRASRHEKAFGEEPWHVAPDAPGRCAYVHSGERAWIILDGVVYEGRAPPPPAESAVMSRFRQSARALQEAVRTSDVIAANIKGALAAFIRATHAPPEPGDDLDAGFCREAVHAGYLESQLVKVDEALAEKLKAYRESYEDLTRFQLLMEGRTADGKVLEWRTNAEGQSCWRLEEPAGPTTTFAIAPRDTMRGSLVVHTVFAGRHPAWPENVEPVRLRMVHRAGGEVARWDPGAGLVVEQERWSRSLRSDPRFHKAEHFGEGDWVVPPHAVRVNSRGHPTALMLPGGTLAAAPFAGPQEREAQDKFLDTCARVLRTPGELHLFYRYFVEYVHDSPVTTAVTLIGSGRHSGDVHQDAYQTLDRWLVGRYLADCDDLAELYQVVLKRQGRLAYVLGVPGHATCGVAEKQGDAWVVFCVDTGPPRQLKGADLDAVLEKVVRTYDADGGMQFDPRQVHFLFRFAGEQTRGEYLLDSRLFRDAEYADLMIRVQEHWHFHFYGLGIETMNTVLKNDRMPANCTELAALLMRVRRFDEAIRWTDAGVAGLNADDIASRLNEHVRKAGCYRSLERDPEAVKVLQGAAAEFEAHVQRQPEDGDRLLRVRFDIALGLAESGDPWSGWALVSGEARGVRSSVLAATLARIYGKMRELERDGKDPTAAQRRGMEMLGRRLEEHFSAGLFRGDESLVEIVRNYTMLMHYFEARDGEAAVLKELVKREYPATRRKHAARRNADPETDWAWIRLSPHAYAWAVAAALDRKDRNAAGRAAAIELAKALEDALPEMRKQGSLGRGEFVVLQMRLTRGCLEMDEAAIRGVFEEMKRQDWGDLYEDLARTLGQTAPHMTPADFEKVFRLFCGCDVPRPHYYGVIYTAYEVKAVAHALAASKICIEKFPADADMRREHELLLKLGK